MANGQVVLLKKTCTCRPMRAVDGEHWEYKYWINALKPLRIQASFPQQPFFVETEPWGPKTPQQRAYPFGLLWQVWQLGEARSKPIFNTCSWDDNEQPSKRHFFPRKKVLSKDVSVGKKDKKHLQTTVSSEAKNAAEKTWDSSHTPWKQP